jgi:hypothetical protein
MGPLIGLENYRSCTWREKREVLRVFWTRRPVDNQRIALAAIEYGRVAVVLICAITLELAVPLVFWHGALSVRIGFALAELFSVWSLIWSLRSLHASRRGDLPAAWSPTSKSGLAHE